MTSVIFHRSAEIELTEAAAYYEQEREGLGKEFLAEIADSVDFAVRFPDAAPIVRGSIRGLVVARFPYSVAGEFQSTKTVSARRYGYRSV